jgi:hypothetical protein
MELEKEFYSITEAARKFKFEEFDIIFLGAFEDLSIYTYVTGLNFEYERFVDEDNDGRPIFKFDGNKIFYTGYLELIDSDLKQVYAEKAVNLKIYKLISDVNQINEWAILDPFDPLIIESLSRLYVKASDIENIINSDNVNESELVNSNSEKIGRRELQHEVILAIIASLNYDPFKIPDGGKSKIKGACLTRTRIFTLSGFDHAWKEGLSKKLFKLENSEKYSNS